MSIVYIVGMPIKCKYIYIYIDQKCNVLVGMALYHFEIHDIFLGGGGGI